MKTRKIITRDSLRKSSGYWRRQDHFFYWDNGKNIFYRSFSAKKWWKSNDYYSLKEFRLAVKAQKPHTFVRVTKEEANT